MLLSMASSSSQLVSTRFTGAAFLAAAPTGLGGVKPDIAETCCVFLVADCGAAATDGGSDFLTGVMVVVVVVVVLSGTEDSEADLTGSFSRFSFLGDEDFSLDFSFGSFSFFTGTSAEAEGDGDDDEEAFLGLSLGDISGLDGLLNSASKSKSKSIST